MKGNQDLGKQPQTNSAFGNQIQSKLLKSFDSVGSVGKKSGHKRYKSSGGSSNFSSFSNESKSLDLDTLANFFT
jgi:ribosomal protein S19E (S16A)